MIACFNLSNKPVLLSAKTLRPASVVPLGEVTFSRNSLGSIPESFTNFPDPIIICCEILLASSSVKPSSMAIFFRHSVKKKK